MEVDDDPAKTQWRNGDVLQSACTSVDDLQKRFMAEPIDYVLNATLTTILNRCKVEPRQTNLCVSNHESGHQHHNSPFGLLPDEMGKTPCPSQNYTNSQLRHT